ncbi:MAG: glycosyltransferase family 4 protein [Bacillota bacterium]
MSRLTRPSIYVVTPGTYPIPANLTGSVELSVMQIFPYLASSYQVTVIGRKQQGVLPSLDHVGLTRNLYVCGGKVNFVQIQSTIKDYPDQLAQHLSQGIKSIIHVENRPALVSRIKERYPLSKIWLNLHSITFLAPGKNNNHDLGNALSLADRISVNSEFLKQYVSHLFPAIQHKVWVNYPGVNHLHYFPSCESKNYLRRGTVAGFSSHGPVILYVGRLRKMKGVDHLIRAFTRVISVYPSAQLLVIGSSDYTAYKESSYTRSLKILASSLGLEKNITFKPHTSADELVKWYQVSDVFVCPSIVNEAFGLVNLEAMSCGIPVIASKIGGIPEVVEHNYSGLLVPLDYHEERLAEAILTLAMHPERARLFGMNGRVRVLNKFTWKHTAERLKKDYQDHY